MCNVINKSSMLKNLIDCGYIDIGDGSYKLRLHENEIIAFVLALLIVAIAKGTVLFNMHYAVDDYYAAITNQMAGGDVLISQGRFGTFILTRLLNIIGVNPIGSYLLNSIMLIVSTICSGIIICRIWKIDKLWELLVVVVLFSIHPFTAEYYTFSISAFARSWGFLLGFIAFYIADKKISRFIVSVILTSFSLSSNQLSLNYYFIVILFSISLFVFEKMGDGALAIVKQYLKTRDCFRALSLIVSIVIYLLVNGLILRIFHVVFSERGTLIHLSEIEGRIKQIISLYKSVFWEDQVCFYPHSIKVILLVLMSLTLFAVIKTLKSKRQLLILSLLIIIFTSFGIIGFNSILKTWWPVPRVLIPASLYFSGLIMIFYRINSSITLNRIYTILVAIVLYSFIATNNNVFSDQQRLNLRDQFRINRLVTRMEMLDKEGQIKKLAIIGGSWSYPHPIQTANGDMNISALVVSWAKLNVAREVTGIDYQAPSSDDIKKIEEYCKTNEKLPVDEVVIIDDIGLFWLK